MLANIIYGSSLTALMLHYDLAFSIILWLSFSIAVAAAQQSYSLFLKVQ